MKQKLRSHFDCIKKNTLQQWFSKSIVRAIDTKQPGTQEHLGVQQYEFCCFQLLYPLRQLKSFYYHFLL